MNSIAQPVAEHDRLAVLDRIFRSGFPNRDILDSCCAVAAGVFQTRIAFIALVGAEEIFYVGRHGFDITKRRRQQGLCDITLQKGEHVLRDARIELAGVENDLVHKKPGLRFYAAVAIQMDGVPIGTIGVADLCAREASQHEMSVLKNLARLIEVEFGQRVESCENAGRLLRQSMRDETRAIFAYGLSHEYSNALTGMIALANTFEKSSPSIAKLHETLAELARLTEHFIGFHEGASARAESVRVNDLVDSVMTMLQYALGEKIKLTVDLDDRVDAVRARAQGLELPIAQLVLQARNAMQGEGALHVSTAVSRFESCRQTDHVELAAGDYIVITISDTSSPAATELLALTQESAAKLGCQIDMTCAPGGGTSFVMYLPVLSRLPAARTRTGRGRLLVVEDHRLVGEALQFSLIREGYQVTVATRAGDDEVKRMLDDARGIDLLISDVLLPGINGIELARKMRDVNPELPVILISGQTDRSHFDPGDVPEGAVFLHKPFAAEVLLKAIADLLRTSEAM